MSKYIRFHRSMWVLALCFQILSCGGCETQKPEAGYTAPDFSLSTIDGKTIGLRDLRGKVVFVNVWATWCPPCRQEIPSMTRFYEMFKDQGVEILALSQDTDIEMVRQFSKQLKMSFPVFIDPDKKIYNLYKATGVPETTIVDKQGVIAIRKIGAFEWTDPEIINAVKTLLAAK